MKTTYSRVFDAFRVWLATGWLGTVLAADPAAVNEILKLKTAGFSDDTIVSFIRGKDTRFDLNADDLVNLQRQGLSSTVLNAMLASGHGQGPGAAPSSGPTAIPTAAPAATPNAPALALSPDAAYFYQELSPHGRWLVVEDNQWCWQPAVVTASAGWRPYWDNGHWVSTDGGWYWASDYAWGWAAFHHGRWELHPHLGWIWFPARVWAPAWVVWRSGGEYCGWAPLPRSAVFDAGRGRFLVRGRAVGFDFDFGLDWMRFNFCYLRELGENPHWRPRGDAEIRGIFERTRVIPGYRSGRSVINGEVREHFVNTGIAPARIAEVRGRPVETVVVRDIRGPIGRDSHERIVPEEKTIQAYRPKFGGKDDRRRRGEH